MLLIAHGARDPAWSRPFEEVARLLRVGDASLDVSLAYLEFMTPGIVEAGARLAAAGCSSIDLMPLFLGAGGHVRKDLPICFTELQAAYPSVDWRLHPAIGEVPSVIQSMADAALQLAGTSSPSSFDEIS